MPENKIGVMGASSLTGQCLLRLLQASNIKAIAFSRTPPSESETNISWHKLSQENKNTGIRISFCICLAPIWVLSDYFDLFLKLGVRRIVALSSTSIFSKELSPSPEERALSERLLAAEQALQHWADTNGIEWIILRPTLIYGHGKDKNIASIAKLIHRFNFFPIFSPARGMRQPIHADDVAKACLMAVQTGSIANSSFNISGSETLTYQNMLERVFKALNKKPRYFHIPLSMFRIVIFIANLLARNQRWTAAMAYRMNQDLVFDHTQATRAFGFQPQPFLLTPEDVIR